MPSRHQTEDLKVFSFRKADRSLVSESYESSDLSGFESSHCYMRRDTFMSFSRTHQAPPMWSVASCSLLLYIKAKDAF